jgi:hypothetical protein
MLLPNLSSTAAECFVVAPHTLISLLPAYYLRIDVCLFFICFDNSNKLLFS